MHHFTGMFVIKYITLWRKVLFALNIFQTLWFISLLPKEAYTYCIDVYTHMLTYQAVCEQDVFAAPWMGSVHFNTQVCVCVCSGQVWKSSAYKVGKCGTSSSVQAVKTILLEKWDFFLILRKKVKNLHYSGIANRPAWKNFMSSKDLRRIRFVNSIAELSNIDTIICSYYFYGCLMLWRGFVFVKPSGK